MKNQIVIKIFAKVSRYLSATKVEPEVKKKCDRQGNCYWQIYDPISGSHYSFGSEQEVRSWLDTRYYYG